MVRKLMGDDLVDDLKRQNSIKKASGDLIDLASPADVKNENGNSEFDFGNSQLSMNADPAPKRPSFEFANRQEL